MRLWRMEVPGAEPYLYDSGMGSRWRGRGPKRSFVRPTPPAETYPNPRLDKVEQPGSGFHLVLRGPAAGGGAIPPE